MLHRSPGITAIYNEVKSSRRNRILDLGAMSVASFQFFSSHSCKIHFENLNDFILEYGGLSTGNLVYRLEKYLLSHNSEEKFDVILAWDLFNYLPLDAVQVLLARIGTYCKPNTLMHSLKYMGARIPSVPAHFDIKDQYHVNIRIESLVERKIERHSTAAFLKKNSQYFLHNNIMNEKGMIRGISEEVLRYMPDKNRRKQYVSSTETIKLPVTNTQRAVGADVKRITEQDSPKYYSPSLRLLFSGSHVKSFRLLDLGAKSPINMQIWRNYFSEVYAEDLFSSLQWRKSVSQPNQKNGLSVISNEALSFGNQKFDVIMLWDILNYCTRDQISAVADRLNGYCHEGTRIIAFSYAGNDIPLRPQKFLLTLEGDVHVADTPKGPRQDDAVTTAGIMKLTKNWSIRNTYIFQPGMKPGLAELFFEYESRYNPQPQQQNAIAKSEVLS